MRYAHTNIVAANWKALAQFYIDVFECVVKPPQRNQSGQWLEEGTGVPNAALEGVHLLLPGHGDSGPTLEVFTYSETVPNEPGPANRQGFAHIAFEVNDLQSVLEKLLEAGGSQAGKVTRKVIEGVGVITFVYARDPEGNIIELQSWEPWSTKGSEKRTRNSQVRKDQGL